MAFVLRLRMPQTQAIRGTIFKQVSNFFSQSWLIVLGDEHIGASTPVHLRTQLPLRMHRIQGDNPPVDQGRRKPRFECADLILLLPDLALPEHHSGRHIVTTELMYGMGLRAGCTKRFPIDGQLSMIEMVPTCLKSAGFVSTALLGLPANEERGQHFIK